MHGHGRRRLYPWRWLAVLPGPDPDFANSIIRCRLPGFFNLVISANRCERSHGYVKSRIRPMRGLKSFACATRLFPALDALQLVERDFIRAPPIGVPCTGGGSYVRARHIASVITRLGQTL